MKKPNHKDSIDAGEDRCQHCRYAEIYQSFSDPFANNALQCKRYPPTIRSSEDLTGVWPRMSWAKSCGEYSFAENKGIGCKSDCFCCTGEEAVYTLAPKAH